MLHIVSRALINLMYPLQWLGIYIPVLPARLLSALEVYLYSLFSSCQRLTWNRHPAPILWVLSGDMKNLSSLRRISFAWILTRMLSFPQPHQFCSLGNREESSFPCYNLLLHIIIAMVSQLALLSMLLRHSLIICSCPRMRGSIRPILTQAPSQSW